jgi:hypothetical protein
MKQVKFHTGPTIVKHIARKFCQAGLFVTIEGTESIYVLGKSERILAIVRRYFGHTFGVK